MDTAVKKKNPFIIFLLVFFVILIVMFMTNTQKTVEQTLSGPLSGVDKLFTIDDKLIAISCDSEVYTWDWQDLSKWPDVKEYQAAQIVPMNNNYVMMIPEKLDYQVVVKNLKDKSFHWVFSKGSYTIESINISSNGKFGCGYYIENETTGKIGFVVIELLVNHNGADLDRPIVSGMALGNYITDKEIVINNSAISNDGKKTAIVGKKKRGWLSVRSSEPYSVWRKDIAEVNELNKVTFSPDGKVVYVSEPGRFVFALNSETGDMIETFEMDKYETPANNPQTISCLTVSSDGRLLAAGTEPASNVWIWDAQSGAKINEITKESYTVSGAAFSPDSLYIATGILVRPNIDIFKVKR